MNTTRPVHMTGRISAAASSPRATLRDRLRICLSGTDPELGSEPLPSVSELAERIKALKSSHSVEALPDRAGQRITTAEEPVTARISRRMEAMLASDPTIETENGEGTSHPR